MKSSLLISTAAAIVIAALAASTSAAGRSILPGFHSPSGNIRCFVHNSLYCSIGQSSYAAQLQAWCMKPDVAGLDWHGFRLTPGARGRVYCTSNPPYDIGRQHPSHAVLPYGAIFRSGAFKCRSRTTGVTCVNANGHGLFISRQAYRVW
jgi:hypothetical protein